MNNLQAMLKKIKNELKNTEVDFNNSILELFNQFNINFTFDDNYQIFNIVYHNKNHKSMIIRMFSKREYQNINSSSLSSVNDFSSLLSFEFTNENNNFLKKRKYEEYVNNPKDISINENFNFKFWFDKLQNLSNKIYTYNKKVKLIIKKLHNQDLNNFKKTTDLLFNYITPEMVEESFKELSNKESFELITLDYHSYFKSAIFYRYKFNRINENTFEYKEDNYGSKKVIGSNQLKDLIKKQFYFKSNIVSDFHSFFMLFPLISNNGIRYTLKLEDVISKFKPYLNAEQF